MKLTGSQPCNRYLHIINGIKDQQREELLRSNCSTVGTSSSNSDNAFFSFIWVTNQVSGAAIVCQNTRKIEFQPLLSVVQGKLEGWTSNLFSYGGRITLVKAVLSAMPLHYMQTHKLHIGIIRHIDRMRRNFLWKGNIICRGINCLANWEMVCSLKKIEDQGSLIYHARMMRLWPSGFGRWKLIKMGCGPIQFEDCMGYCRQNN